MSQEQEDVVVGRMVREHGEAKTRLSQLRGESQELGNQFEELGRKLKKFSARITEGTSQATPDNQQIGLEKFFPSLGGVDNIKAFEQHLSKGTYESIGKWITEAPEVAKQLAELNQKLKLYDLW